MSRAKSAYRTRKSRRCPGIIRFADLVPVMAVGLWGGALARADVVSAQGRTLAVDVRITGLREGLLSYRTAGGQEVSRPIEQIRYLQISGWDAFNQAERQQRDGNARSAIELYEKSLAEAVDAAGLDRRLLVRCRLIGLYDAAGRFDRAVACYLDVLEAMPACVDTLRPGRVPTDAEMLRTAGDLVARAVARRDPLDPVGDALEHWRATWPDGRSATRPADDRRPDRPAVISAPATRPTVPADDPLLAAVSADLAAGAYDRAARRIAEAIKDSPTSPPSEWFYWQGRACQELAAKGREPAVHRRRAGLAFLRVVIRSPESPLAAECLFRAAEVCRDEGRPDRAAALLTELIQTRPSATPWAARAREMLAGLKTASAPTP
ncbi:MAG: hypothetical protein AMXMBFR83_07200 [Phycisphaerae bacterium]